MPTVPVTAALTAPVTMGATAARRANPAAAMAAPVTAAAAVYVNPGRFRVAQVKVARRTVFPAVALADQWGPPAQPFVRASQMYARIDAQINAMATEMNQWGHDFASFFGTLTSAFSAANANIPFAATIDTAAGWNPAAGTYTVTTPGLYMVSFSGKQMVAVNNNARIFGLGSAAYRPMKGPNQNNVNGQISAFAVERCNGGEIISVQQATAVQLWADAAIGNRHSGLWGANTPDTYTWLTIAMIGH